LRWRQAEKPVADRSELVLLTKTPGNATILITRSRDVGVAMKESLTMLSAGNRLAIVLAAGSILRGLPSSPTAVLDAVLRALVFAFQGLTRRIVGLTRSIVDLRGILSRASLQAADNGGRFLPLSGVAGIPPRDVIDLGVADGLALFRGNLVARSSIAGRNGFCTSVNFDLQ
jgi:hypothetical protein